MASKQTSLCDTNTMDTLNKIVRRLARAPRAPVGVGVTYLDGRQVDCAFSELPGMIDRDIGEIVMIVGDVDECYEIMFRIQDGNVASEVVYHAVDFDQDACDGHRDGGHPECASSAVGHHNRTVINKTINKKKIKFTYEYKRTVVIPVVKIAKCIADILV